MNLYWLGRIGLLTAYASFMVLPVYATVQPAEAAMQSFYSWYVSHAMISHNEPAWAKVLHSKPAVLSAELRSYLKADLNKKAHDSGMIEGIDFDPFLGGQDPCPHFEINKSRIEQAHYLVNVRPICVSGADQPSVTVSLTKVKNQFVIDDVIYGGGRTLRRALRAR